MKRRERAEVRTALAMMRDSVGFIVIVDTPHPDRDRVENAIRHGEAPPTNLRLFATEQFQPARKVAATLAVMARSLYTRLDHQSQAPGPLLSFKGELVSDNGKVKLGPRHLHHVVFGTDGDYQERLELLALEEEVPPGQDPGQGTSRAVWSAVYEPGADYGRVHFAKLAEWAHAQVREMTKATQWAQQEVSELLDRSLIQLRKTWQQEAEQEASEGE